jgi:AraC-like DNA-binding protein
VTLPYREQAPPWDLGPWVRCLWVSVPPPGGGPGWVVPDGCLDLIRLDGELIVAGPDDLPEYHPPRPARRPEPVLGVRFRPGRAGPLLREAPGRLRNRRVALADLGPVAVDRLAERVAEAPTPAAAMALLVDEVRRRAAGAREPDGVATAAADLLLASGGGATIGGVADELAVSERHLRRRATEALGYGPKTFARIVRFQRALTLLHGGGHGLADVAARTGYADQAHLTREVTELAGRPPGQIRSDGRADAGGVAGSFKTADAAAP